MTPAVCSIEDCGLPVLASGWCTAHYQRWSRHGDPLAGGARRRTTLPLVPCSYEGCERMARRGNTICKIHQHREWQQAQGACSVEGCPRRAGARGLCGTHYQRWRAGDEGWQEPIPERMKRGEACLVEGCPQPVYARGYCAMHHQRWHRNGDPGPVGKLKADRGAGSVDPKSGYRYLTVNGRRIAEHRYVLEQLLGRPLEPWETPHHRNGQRADNRPENLELWVKPQPAGQRLEDLITFIVEHYPGELESRDGPGPALAQTPAGNDGGPARDEANRAGPPPLSPRAGRTARTSGT